MGIQSTETPHNAVAGGTGAQATALIAAGLITVAVGTAIVALFTWVSFDFGLGAVTSYMDVNPFNGGGVVAGACGCLISHTLGRIHRGLRGPYHLEANG